MKNRIIALALVIVMLFAMSACGKKPAAAPEATAEPAAPAETAAPEDTPEPTPAGIEPDSGVHSISSKSKGFSIDFDSKYVANELPSGAIIINAGTDEGIPYVTVSIIEKEIMGVENAADATSYLLSQAQAAKEELGDALTDEPNELPSLIEGRNLVGFAYAYNDQDVGGKVICTYFGEALDSGEIVVYHSRCAEGEDVNTVNDILKLAAESFKLEG